MYSWVVNQKPDFLPLWFVGFHCVNVHLSDPQDEVNTASVKPGAPSDWLTLNIGGRLFTTTRYDVGVNLLKSP